RFLARGAAERTFLTDDGATLAVGDSAVSLRVVGGARVQPNGFEKLSGKTNYFVGERSQWATGVEGYGRVRYAGVLPGVDIVYRGTGLRQLEFDVVLAPHTDPRSVKLSFEGSARQRLDTDGSIILRLSRGDEIRQPPPYAYQESITGDRHPIAARYEL